MIDLDTLSKFCAARGFVYAGSAPYGGLANAWDFGPLGVELHQNIRAAWWRHFVHGRSDVEGLDAAILMHPRTWEASGHVESFSDPLADCRDCRERFRADKLIEEAGDDRPADWAAEKTPPASLHAFLNEHITCPARGCKSKNWTEPKNFNLMFRTEMGVVAGTGRELYLRPETAQGIFVDFPQVLQSSRRKLPFGIAQIGKSFRNEITPGNFIFRTREFTQMEMEYFFDPTQQKGEELLKTFEKDAMDFCTETLGITADLLRLRPHEADELSHYSRGTTDVEFRFPFGWGELAAAGAYRTDFDLSRHAETSGKKDFAVRREDGTTFIPHVLEPSFGVERLLLAVLFSAYREEQMQNGETRTVMSFPKEIAPVKFAVYPLQKSGGLLERSKDLFESLIAGGRLGRAVFDAAGSIGKRYRRADEIGVPTCITVDFETLENDTVTLRDRDSLDQRRVSVDELPTLLAAG